ncbi:MAG: DUF5995 family protein [Actinomycetota bacterium]
MLGDVTEALRTTALAAPDARGHFAAMYARVTDRVDRHIAAGRFDDEQRMDRFVRAFADWYLAPIARTRPMPSCWQAAYDVANDDLIVVQHLLLGINAHVNHDLPQVVVELAAQEQTVHALQRDFDAVNDVLAEVQPAVLRDLGRVSGLTQVAALYGGSHLFRFSLQRARAQAWDTAVRLHGMSQSARRDEVVELDRVVTAIAYLVSKPTLPLSWLLPIVRWLEVSDSAEVTRRLLGPLQ